MTMVYSLPKWVGQQQVEMSLPEHLRPWLFDVGSMTKRLRNFAKQSMTVQLLGQDWGQPTISESLYLQLALRNRSLIREVYLLCDGKIIVFGRSIFPLKLFEGKGRKLLALLDTKPIGDLLFKEPTMKRTPLQFAKLNASHLEFCQATQGATTSANNLWARRSRFYLHDQPLLVTEVIFSENIDP